jgi:hypothetical protein
MASGTSNWRTAKRYVRLCGPGDHRRDVRLLAWRIQDRVPPQLCLKVRAADLDAYPWTAPGALSRALRRGTRSRGRLPSPRARTSPSCACRLPRTSREELLNCPDGANRQPREVSDIIGRPTHCRRTDPPAFPDQRLLLPPGLLRQCPSSHARE